MGRNIKVMPFVNHMKKTECVAGEFMDDQWFFLRILCSKPGSTEEFLRKYEILVFKQSTDTS